jgi:hypothetical protein
VRARVALLTVLALALPAAAADAKPSHFLKLYKVEQHIDLEGEEGFYDLSCKGTDIAIDGMYRIDAVDQDNEFTRLELLKSVWQVASYPLSDTDWRFQFTPTLGGDVQVKLWLTCLGRLTEPNNHQHSWALTQQQVPDARPALPAGAFETDHVSGDCAAGEIPVQTGWRLLSPSGGELYTFRSWPTASLRNWHWGVLVGQASDVVLYRSCLSLRSSSVNGHRHRIVTQFRPGFGGSLRPLPTVDNRTDQDLACGDHYKGMHGAWWINDPFHVWWFGMEPRIKSRTFWFGNDGLGSNQVYIALRCFKDRTT